MIIQLKAKTNHRPSSVLTCRTFLIDIFNLFFLYLYVFSALASHKLSRSREAVREAQTIYKSGALDPPATLAIKIGDI